MKKTYSSRRSKPQKSRKVLLSLCCAILLLAGGGFFVFFSTKDASETTSNQTVGQDNINFDPPTTEEKQAVDEQKDKVADPVETSPSPNTPGDTKKALKPVIVSAANGFVRSFVPGVIEDGGICTALFTKAGQTVTKTSSASADAQNTLCAPINYQDTSVISGWSVIISYESTTTKGSSDAVTIQ